MAFAVNIEFVPCSIGDHVNSINRSAGVALSLIAVLPVTLCFVVVLVHVP